MAQQNGNQPSAPAKRGREFGEWIDQLHDEGVFARVVLTLKSGQVTLIEYQQTYKDVSDALRRRGIDAEAKHA